MENPSQAVATTGAGIATSQAIHRELLSSLHRKSRKYLEPQLRDGESIIGIIKGGGEQALVALDHRLIIVKPGMMAGSTFGARVTSFEYRDISAIEVNTKLATAIIEVMAPGYQGTRSTSYWDTSNKSGNSAWQISNCLPLSRKAADAALPIINLIRERIQTDRHPSTAVGAPATGIAEQLEKLAALNEQRVLSDSEFEAAKARVLSGQ